MADVVSQESNLERGFALASVRMKRAGIVVLSVSFDPGWTARVDGRPAKVFPVAPALVATTVPVGVHTVKFQYAGFASYPVLFLLSGLSVVSLAIVDWKRRRRHQGGRHSPARMRPGADERHWLGRGARRVGSGQERCRRDGRRRIKRSTVRRSATPANSSAAGEESHGETDEAVTT